MAQLTVQQAFNLAVQHHQAGQLLEAEQIYRQILALQPTHIQSLHNLGAIALQQGRKDVAVSLIRQATLLRPNDPKAHNNLGNALKAQGLHDEAIAAFRQAIALNANLPEVYNNLGGALNDKGQIAEAIAAYRQAIALRPDYAEAHNNLGLAFLERDRIEEAIVEFETTIKLRPQYDIAHNNLGNALLKKKCFEQSIAEFQTALTARPDYPEALINMGLALRAMGEAKRSISFYKKALASQPELYEAMVNMGQALCDLQQFDNAIDLFRKAISIRPADYLAHFHLSAALLVKGRFSEGWREYEWRLQKPEVVLYKDRSPKPLWTDQDLAGKRIYVHWEQGAGDLIQFCRLAPILTQRGAMVILDCAPDLFRLLGSLKGVERIVIKSPQPDEYDLHCYLQSLPFLLDIKLETIPSQVPYLNAEPALMEQWRTRLASVGTRKKVGLAWAGNPKHSNDQLRSMPLAAFAPLAELRDVELISLQKGNAGQHLLPGLSLRDYTQDLSDYADTAALIANLDLIIAVDTSVVHLAGAMGKPVWALLPFIPEWRWMLEREDSPWYPSMRLFRQPARGNWESVIAKIVSELSR